MVTGLNIGQKPESFRNLIETFKATNRSRDVKKKIEKPCWVKAKESFFRNEPTHPRNYMRAHRTSVSPIAPRGEDRRKVAMFPR